MSRSRVRAGSALAAVVLAVGLLPARGLADQSPDLWFAGTRLIFERAQQQAGEVAVTPGDPGLVRFLARLGASIAYAPGQRYAVVTAADRRTITFTLGDTRVNAGGVTTSASFAPYVSGEDVYVSLAALARALYVVPQRDGATTVLQPQFGALDVRSDGTTTVVTLHAASALAFRRDENGAERLTLTFAGFASSLDQHRSVNAPGLAAIGVRVGGTLRSPTTTVSFELPPGAARAILPSASPNDLTLAFAPPGVALRGTPIPAQGTTAPSVASSPQTGASSEPPSEATPNAAAPPASVTAVTLGQGQDDATNVEIAVSGDADFEWHRLGDGRWYVDVKGATLAIPSRDDALSEGGITALRVRQFALDPLPIVRVSLSLSSMRRVDVVPSSDGITVVVGNVDDPYPMRVGLGHVGGGAPSAYAVPGPEATPWKFSPESVLPQSANPRLIVLDPGHGGSDVGAQHNGLTEKDLTLDVSLRLRGALVNRGWTVRLTRETDTDVYAPNDSAHDELQARCDVANKAGARMFVSIHVNSFTTSALSGTTTYYYKGIDLPLARAVHRRLIASLGTKDDGVRKDNFYVIHHTTMPAVLVETAFLSNSGDAALLRSSEFLQRVAQAIADGIGDYAAHPQSEADASE
jgi:N-acetylmuramoyl-L-alanine amidase